MQKKKREKNWKTFPTAANKFSPLLHFVWCSAVWEAFSEAKIGLQVSELSRVGLSTMWYMLISWLRGMFALEIVFNDTQF